MAVSKTKSKTKAGTTSRTSTQRKTAAKLKYGANTDTKTKSAATKQANETAESSLRDGGVQSTVDWRAETLQTTRRLIQEADPEIVEERKWKKPSDPLGVPVWSRMGMICTGETYNQVVKLTFARGASLPDPHGLFNAGLEGNARRAIDIREGETIDAKAFKGLIRTAVAANLRICASKSKSAPSKAAKTNKEAAQINTSKPVKLLSGGNPQIAKADGDAPVQAYIAAMPGWKSDLGRCLDALIVRNVPQVRKAVKWNSPFYGVEGQGWFLSFHVFTRYVKVTFFNGTSLRPVPTGGTPKSKDVRWMDLHEGEFDEAQLTTWVKQAAKLPGWKT